MGAPVHPSVRRSLAIAAVLAAFATVALAIYGGGPGEMFAALRSLSIGTVALASVGVLFEWTFDTVRYVLAGRAVGISLGLRAWFEIALITLFAAYVANIGIPVAAYAMTRRGAPAGEALAVAVGKNLLFFPSALGPAWALLFFARDRVGGAGVFVSVSVLAGLAVLQLGAMLAVAFFPDASARFFARIPVLRRFEATGGFVTGMARFFRGAPLLLVLSLVVALLNQGSIVATFAVLFRGLGGDAFAPGILARAYLFSTLSQVSPTPGGAGVGEASGVLLFRGLLPDAKVAAFVAAARFASAILPIALGGLFFARDVRAPRPTGGTPA